MRQDFEEWIEKMRVMNWPDRSRDFTEQHYEGRWRRLVERELNRKNELIDSPVAMKEYLERVFVDVAVPIPFARKIYDHLAIWYPNQLGHQNVT